MKNAYVTFIIKNDQYVSGALVLAYGLLKQNVRADLVCLVTDDVSDEAVEALELVYTKVIVIDNIIINHSNQSGRNDRDYLFTRFQALRLGEDGDLGCDYSKIVLIDSDVLPLKNYDDLFDIQAPAGIINECKENWYSDLVFEEGKSIWHQVYESICPHGQKIPSDLIDKVWHDTSNLGVNACLWVLEPNMTCYKEIITSIRRTEVYDKLAQFNWPEMQFATYFWSGQWHSIDLRYCAYNGQPKLEQVYGTHFAGYKPWHDQNRKVLKRYLGYDDFKLWYAHLHELVEYVYPQMKGIANIIRLVRYYKQHVLNQ